MFQQHDLTPQEGRPARPSLAATAAAPQFIPPGYMQSSILTQRVSINGMRPLALTKKQAIAVLGSAKLVDRMLWATRYADAHWFTLIREGRDLLVATESVESAYARLVTGGHP